ncbi:MAG TPA: serpin family protein [Armatimonadota bacterium]|nr:serpin family protein [Armatimonadota bacterium]HQK93714.1 serpin family protein [Armatimonadota bacterium]
MRRLLQLVLVVLVAANCSSGCKAPGPEGGERHFAAPLDIEAPGALVRSNKPHDPAPKVPDADLKALADGNREFACALYHELAGGEGNLVFSPMSISTAMAMAYAGARGRTAEQLADVLHFDLPSERLHPAFNSICLALQPPQGADDKTVKLTMLNALWAQKGGHYLDSFLDTLAANYDAGMHELDIAGDPAGACKAINRWIKEATGGRIAELAPAGGMNGVALAVTNAVYFRGYWNYQFDEKDTHDEPFHRLDGDRVTVKMMHQTHSFDYCEGDGYQAVSLPYYFERQSMVVVLPQAGQFEHVEAALDGDFVSGLQGHLRGTRVELGLPRLGFSGTAELAQVLARMGAPDAFSDGADFSGITGSPGLFISNVCHGAFLSVNEKWTEAAAATEVAWKSMEEPSQPVRLIADRPFMFLIVDRPSGAILFMGRVMDPTA